MFSLTNRIKEPKKKKSYNKKGDYTVKTVPDWNVWTFLVQTDQTRNSKTRLGDKGKEACASLAAMMLYIHGLSIKDTMK